MNQKLANVSIFLAGLLFGLGLVISGMSNPAKVIGFLDLAGDWDPSLLLVMGVGVGVTLPAYHFVLKRAQPLFVSQFFLPARKGLDAKLITGAAIFGLGWGVAGFCPGPALVSLVSLNSSVIWFVAAMIGGMAVHRFTIGKG